MAIINVIIEGLGTLIQVIMMWPGGGFFKAKEVEYDKDGEEIGTILTELSPHADDGAAK
jgi:hypothetical protein